MAAMKQ